MKYGTVEKRSGLVRLLLVISLLAIVASICAIVATIIIGESGSRSDSFKDTDTRLGVLNKILERLNVTDQPVSHEQTSHEQMPGPCDPIVCRLPTCRCPGTDIPGNLSPSNTPMLVMVSFDDALSTSTLMYFDDLFNASLKNPNECPISGTFFVYEQTSDFETVELMYNRGHEIASHSRTHRYPISWWANASISDYEGEIHGMRVVLSQNTNIPLEEIRGMRVPFLQLGGDNQYEMLVKNNFSYDSSFVTGDWEKNLNPPVWPFTLDYPVNWSMARIEPRPRKSYPGIWEIPLIRFYGNDGQPCAMADSCSPSTSPEMALKYFRDNFKRHYMSNRAPFGVFMHTYWFHNNHPYAFSALRDFMRELSEMDDVWLVTMTQAIKWIQRPVTISQLKNDDMFACV